MRMYAVRDKDSPDTAALTSYYRTVEEAEAHVSQASRIDRWGEHPGSEYLEIVVVERDSYPCVLCAGEVTSKNPERYPYCRSCHYTGSAAEHIRDDQMTYFIESVPWAESITIDHTGGGCFWLAFRFSDRSEYVIATDGEAALPADDASGEWIPVRGGWGAVAVMDDERYDEESPMLFYSLTPESSKLTDEQLVELVRGWYEGKIQAEPLTTSA